MVAEERSVHSDPDIMGGTLVFVGTRVPVKNLFDYLRGSGLEEFLRQFPSVSREHALCVVREHEIGTVSDEMRASPKDIS